MCNRFQKYIPKALRSAKPTDAPSLSKHAILEQVLGKLVFHKVPSLTPDFNDVSFMRFKGHIAEFVIDIDSRHRHRHPI